MNVWRTTQLACVAPLPSRACSRSLSLSLGLTRPAHAQGLEDMPDLDAHAVDEHPVPPTSFRIHPP